MKKKKVRKSVVFEGVENGNGENGEFGGEDKVTAESHSMSMFFGPPRSSCSFNRVGLDFVAVSHTTKN